MLFKPEKSENAGKKHLKVELSRVISLTDFSSNDF